MANIIYPQWKAPSSVCAFTTLRDCDLNIELTKMGIRPYNIKQVDGSAVVWAQDETLTDDLPEADAVVTRATRVGCMVRTADCLPVLICNASGTQVAAVHAGWRGLAAGVIGNTLRHFANDVSGCHVWLGPAIGPEKFEVGADVLEGFAQHGWSMQHISAGFKNIVHKPGKWLGDLYFLARCTLQEQGVLNERITGGNFCTFSEADKFYSHRRAKETGRMSSIIFCELL